LEVTSYIFQSPYPSNVQYGRPDPLSQTQERQQENTQALSSTPDTAQNSAQSYAASQPSAAVSVNVAASSTDAGVSASMETFSTLNSQVQAAAAYSS